MQNYYPLASNNNYFDRLNRLSQMQTQFAQQYPQYNNYQYQNNQIVFVQGETGAKAYQIPTNTTVLLMSSESNEFFIKTTDQAGFPTIKKFKFEEITQNNNAKTETQSNTKLDKNDYVTRLEFEQLKECIKGLNTNESNNADFKSTSNSKKSDTKRS